jgi:hypothetical protein
MLCLSILRLEPIPDLVEALNVVKHIAKPCRGLLMKNFIRQFSLKKIVLSGVVISTPLALALILAAEAARKAARTAKPSR